MSATTSIEWADKTWSPLIGCDRVSPGCDHCYAITTARIRSSNPHPAIAAAFAGTTERNEDGVDWTGKVNLLANRLTEPLHWRKPARVFVNSMSDLFHADVPDEFIARVFAVMSLAPQHTFQILTKRHARMRSLLASPEFEKQVDQVLLAMPELSDSKVTKRSWPLPKPGWPLPNVWLGVSVENQKWADIRIPALLETPAAVRFLSCEPLLGPIDLRGPLVAGRGRPKLTYWLDGRPGWGPEQMGPTGLMFQEPTVGPRIDWVIVGGESGHGARPMHPNWARTIRDQCQHSGVPFLFKQFGDWGLEWPLDSEGRIVRGPRGLGMTLADDGTLYAPGDLSYPDGPRYGEAVRAGHQRAHLTAVYRVGKKAAGRELDGRTWDEYPGGAS